MDRNTNLYGDGVAVLNPSRWGYSKLAKIDPGFVSFHAGPRTCFGSKLQPAPFLFFPWGRLERTAGDFEFTKASFGIVQLIQAFPDLRLPPDASTDPIGQEWQSLTIAGSSADCCKVLR
jgi:hypothetical protein